jgi:hypothetical protein
LIPKVTEKMQRRRNRSEEVVKMFELTIWLVMS